MSGLDFGPWLARLQVGWRGSDTPLIWQSEAAECGLACLAMVASAQGWRTDLAALRDRFKISMKGCTAADLARMGQQLGLVPRALRAEMDHLPQLRRPCILHWDLNHFVVLVAVAGQTVTVHDPARGVRQLSLEEVSKHFTGVVLEFTPGPRFSPGDETRRLSWSMLLGPVRGLGRALTQIWVLALLLELLMMLSPLFMQAVVDGILVSAERELLPMLALGFGGLVLIQALTAAARAWAILHLATHLQLQWMGQVFAHVLRLPLAWFERRHMGDVLSRFAAVQQIQDKLTGAFAEGLIDGAMVLLTLALMLAYSPLMGGMAIVAMGLYGALRRMVWPALREATQDSLVSEAKRSSHFLESLRGMSAIKLMQAQTWRQNGFMNLAVDGMNAQVRARRWELKLAAGQRVVFGLLRVMVIWQGAHAVMNQQLSLGMLFAFLAYQEQFILRSTALVDKLQELRLMRLQGERLADIVMTPPEPAESPLGPDATGPAPSSLGLVLKGVHFRYADHEPEVLKGVDLEIRPGESVAIAGPSGGGKTTLLKLLMGIHAPTAGEVWVDGQLLGPASMGAWRQRLGVVLQEEPLFAGSIADNICFFGPDPDPQWLEQCARQAAIHDEVVAMPMGYATLVGDMGTVLSAGQKQRVLLARALYRRPQILLLDEATSALDVAREQAVNEAVAQLKLTRIIVAHRPQTIASCERVVVLVDGMVKDDRMIQAPATGSA